MTHLLEPILIMALAGGPMKTMPSAANRSANHAFSLRKPYPGCTAYTYSISITKPLGEKNANLCSTAMAHIHNIIYRELRVYMSVYTWQDRE